MARYKTEAAEYEAITVRLPKNVMNFFRARAARERRSMNAELLVFIEKCMEKESHESQNDTHQPVYS